MPPIIYYSGPEHRRMELTYWADRITEKLDELQPGLANQCVTKKFSDGTVIRVQRIRNLGEILVYNIVSPFGKRKEYIEDIIDIPVPILEVTSYEGYEYEDFFFWDSSHFNALVYYTKGNPYDRIAESFKLDEFVTYEYYDLEMIQPEIYQEPE